MREPKWRATVVAGGAERADLAEFKRRLVADFNADTGGSYTEADVSQSSTVMSGGRPAISLEIQETA